MDMASIDATGPVERLDMCCGKKNCPVNDINSDGSLTIRDGQDVVHFTAEQAQQLSTWLRDKLSS